MIFGGNIIGLALGALGSQSPTWEQFTGRADNSAGYTVATYAAPVTIQGSVQPVPQKSYQSLGLDWSKEYVTLYTPAGVVGVARDGSGDRITYNGAAYICQSSSDWKAQDGWVAIVAVKVPAP